MNNNHTMWRMNREHHNELLEVAQAQRSINKPKAKRVKARDSLFVNVGDALVSFGLWLKARRQSVTQ